MDKHKILYKCDPEKHHSCGKSICKRDRLTDGCDATKHKEYAKVFSSDNEEYYLVRKAPGQDGWYLELIEQTNV